MESGNNYRIYTVGHSNHPIEDFLGLLRAHSVTCLIDVRTTPASAYNSQFNKHPLTISLEKDGVRYLHLGEEFGARRNDPSLLNAAGIVDFEKVRSTPLFLQGVSRLREGLKKDYRMALMCAEADPFHCHRFAMISYYLSRNGFEVMHIMKDKTLTTNKEIEERLLEKYRKHLPQTNLFETVTTEQQLAIAYRLRNMDVGFDTMKEE